MLNPRTILILICLTAASALHAAGGAMNLKHPVVDWKLGSVNQSSTIAQADAFLKTSENTMLSFVPPYGYNQYTECPNCYGGAEGNAVLTWTINRPEELKCRFCDTVVYPNPKYAEDKVLTGKNALGETVTFPYYYNEQEKAPHFFSTHLWQHKRRWLLEQVNACARAYSFTGKDEYARPVALVLDKLAQVYPHYPVMQNLCRRYAFREQKPPYAWDSGKWNYFHNEVPIEVIPAYDLVYASSAFDSLSAERGYDVREKVEKDFLRASVEAAMAYPDYVSNIIGYSPRSAALLGQVINEPGFVHWAFGWMAANVEKGFFRDGLWSESPAYHYMTIGGLKSCFEAVQGYSDPPGYTDPDGTRYDKLDPLKQLPLWDRCLVAPDVISHPDGVCAVVHDTHPYARTSKPRTETVSTILPGYGHASLGRGRGANQLQAQLHFSGGYGHAHYDACNLTLWGQGRELCPDIGYTWTQMRYWATSTLGHNLVVVDRKDQTGRAEGNLLSYFPGDRSDAGSLAVSAVEADGSRAWPEVKGLDLYRRLVMVVPISEDDAYVVDVFRVRGGTIHDWTLNGDADHDTVATCSVPLTGKRQWLLEEGEEWKEPRMEWAPHNPYGMVRDVASGDCTGGAVVDYAYPDNAARGLRVHVFTDGPSELLLGRSPSVRRMGVGSSGDMRKGYDFWLPKLLVRRQGQELQSTFTAVYEPHSGKPFLAKVTPLNVTPDDGTTVLKIEHGNATDYVFSSAGPAESVEHQAQEGLRFQGQSGVARLQDGKLTNLWLAGGTRLAGAGWGAQTDSAGYTGAIDQTTRKLEGAAEDALITAAALPAGETLRGQWLIATLPNGCTEGYEISRVEKRDGKTVIVTTEDHALRVEGQKMEEVYFPQRKLEGVVTFRIPSLVSIVRQPNGTYKTNLTAKAEVSLPQ